MPKPDIDFEKELWDATIFPPHFHDWSKSKGFSPHGILFDIPLT